MALFVVFTGWAILLPVTLGLTVAMAYAFLRPQTPY